ncbi:MAG: GNAT family N-acetyltransferase [Thalassolituus sp.]
MHQLTFQNPVSSFEYLVIASQRISLIPISERFSEDIYREFTAEITRYMMPPPPQDISETLEFIRSSIEGMQRSEEFVFAIVDTGGKFLGCAGLHARESSLTPELGIWIKKSAHGSALGREAVHCLRDWASANLIVSHFIYPVEKNNLASRKVAESLGGVVIKEQEILSLSGNLLDEVVYHIHP